MCKQRRREGEGAVAAISSQIHPSATSSARGSRRGPAFQLNAPARQVAGHARDVVVGVLENVEKGVEAGFYGIPLIPLDNGILSQVSCRAPEVPACAGMSGFVGDVPNAVILDGRLSI